MRLPADPALAAGGGIPGGPPHGGAYPTGGGGAGGLRHASGGPGRGLGFPDERQPWIRRSGSARPPVLRRVHRRRRSRLRRRGPPPPASGVGYDTDDLMRQLQPVAPKRSRRGWRSWFGLGPSKAELGGSPTTRSARSSSVRSRSWSPTPRAAPARPRSRCCWPECSARPAAVAWWWIDNNENRGTAAFRSYFPAPSYGRRSARGRRPAGAAGGAVHRSGLLPGPPDVRQVLRAGVRRVGHPGCWTRRLFARVHRILSRFFAVIIIDSGNNELASNWLAALDVADGLVVPTPWQQDHVVTANKMLKTLRDRQHPDPGADHDRRHQRTGRRGAGRRRRPRTSGSMISTGTRSVEIPTDSPHPRGRRARLRQAGQGAPGGPVSGAAAVASLLIVDVASRPRP